MTMPWMKYRCASTNTSSTGSMDTSVMAMILAADPQGGDEGSQV